MLGDHPQTHLYCETEKQPNTSNIRCSDMVAKYSEIIDFSPISPHVQYSDSPYTYTKGMPCQDNSHYKKERTDKSLEEREQTTRDHMMLSHIFI